MTSKSLRMLCLMVFSFILISCLPDGQEDINANILQSQEDEVVEETTIPLAIPTDMSVDESEIMVQTQLVEAAETVTVEVSDEIDYSELNPEDWRIWPVLPVVSDEMISIYENGLQLGINPNSFSIFGDCQSYPEVYMGGYETGEYEILTAEQTLQATIDWFEGSFNREAVTIKKGTTTAAILWEGWVDEENTHCEYGESPLECELRIHNPSIVMINLGTHWEVRNGTYLRKILEELINLGIVPIISTKADTREGDAWINEELVQIAAEYKVPVWNFWRAVQELDNQGMLPNDTMYLSEEGLEVQRLSSLQTLDAVLQQLTVD